MTCRPTKLYSLLRPLLFAMDPEQGHDLARLALSRAQRFPPLLRALTGPTTLSQDARLGQTLMGIHFPNPVGLAAGFDKNAEMVTALAALGFGFIEVGSVTPKPQTGNPKPRLFRFIAEQSLQNAMGFNNAGSTQVRDNLAPQLPASVPIGINLGKNKDTAADQALSDYQQLVAAFQGMADYLVINLSSPNTPGLRDLQNESFVRDLFQLTRSLTNKPVLLKIAPDLPEAQAITLAQYAVSQGAAGIIATNTTTDYTLLPGANRSGGISGRALRAKSFAILQSLARELFGHTLLISVGGVDEPDEAYRRLRAGAHLVQLYSGMIFHGPELPQSINDGLLRLFERDGVRNVAEVIGTDLKK